MSSSFQIIKSSWEISIEKEALGSKYKADPFIIIKNLENSEISKKYLLANDDIRIFVTNDRQCIGYEVSQGKWIECPNHTKIIGSQLQCPLCEQTDFYSCRSKCQGIQCFPTSLEAKAICDRRETYLYLTYVAGHYKVGVTLNPIRRWIEQGSSYGLLLHQGFGLETRLYEQAIGKALNLKLAVHISDKINSLGAQLPPRNQIKAEFSNYIRKIKNLSLFDLQNEPILYNLTKYYKEIPTLNQKPIVDNRIVKGRILGVMGRLLVAQDKNSIYVTNLKEIIGKILTHEKPQNDQAYTKQRTIYDYRD